MKRNDFISLVCDELMNQGKFYQKSEIDLIMRVIDTLICEEIFAKEDKLRTGIGVFSGYTKKGRVYRNPSTGEKIQVPDKKGYPKFHPSATAKE